MASLGNPTKQWRRKKMFTYISLPESRKRFTNKFCEASITFTLTHNKNSTRKRRHRPISFINIGAKLLNKI